VPPLKNPLSKGTLPQRVGLLGGSFNPAHEGHLHISREALRRLKLDALWWLVSPQNPLKPSSDMAPLKKRVARAKALADDPRIIVTSPEKKLKTRYSIDTVRALKELFPDTRFVWIIGADNMAQIHKWHSWRSLFRTLPIAVLARPSYSFGALSGRAARRFSDFRLPESKAAALVGARPPAWAFISIRPHTASATSLRKKKTKDKN
jgi:nicotinate-nucleotide adenylyltransferase